jgi:hypothetical protein
MGRLFIRTAAGILAAALVLAGCGDGAGGGDGTGGGDIPSVPTGTLTIQNVPGGTDTFGVYITTQTITANYLPITTNYSAIGGALGSPSGTVVIPLYTAPEGGTGFTGAGTYSILIIGTSGQTTLLLKAVNGKSFSNGSATITWADLQNVSGMGGNGVLTVTDVPGGTGVFAVYILQDEITADNYLTAIGSFAATGAVTESPGATAAVPLYTTAGGAAAFNSTGEYSVLVYNLTPPLALALNYVEFSSGGAEISWNDLEEVSGMTGPAFLDLTDNVWYDNILLLGQTHTYQFYAEQGKTYYVSWNDRHNGDNTKTGSTKVSAAWKSGGTAIFTNPDSGYTSPRSIYASKSGYIKITVEINSTYYPGTYGLVYWERTGNAALQINFAVSGAEMGVSGDLRLDKSEGNQITISAANAVNCEDFTWLLDGVEITDETSGSITLDAADYEPGLYRLTLIAYRDGVPYSGEAAFAVVE